MTTTLRYDDRGTGPVVLMVPGLATTAAYFAPAVEDLARDHRVVTVELPGHGRGAAPAPDASVELAAEAVGGVVDGLGLRDITLLGWSAGAYVCYRHLELHGDRVRGLVSVEQTPKLTLADDWPHAAFGGLDEAGAKQLEHDIATDLPAFAATLVGACFAAGAEPDGALVAELVAQSRSCDPEAVRAFFADASAQDWRARVAALGVPTLLVHGARSQVYPTAVGDWLAGAIPGARLETFDDSGHLPFREERTRFAASVRAFVRSLDHD